MLRKLLMTGVFLVSTGLCAFAQTGTITGTVTDAQSGETLPGTNVYISSIQKGDITNSEGHYTITDIPAGSYTLQASFVGYTAFKQQVEVTSGTQTINIALKSGLGLDQMVVTGYGSESKRQITGSVSTVSTEEIENVPVQNAVGALQGRASGVTISTTSGTPGSGFQVRVRGQGSINGGNDPLYIVDGVQMSFTNQSGTNDDNPLNAIDPNDIESIQVLKDAASAAIYGAQAANGVVIITTKSGTQKPQITASVERGVTTTINSVDYFNRDQFIEFFGRAFQYDYPGSFGQPGDADGLQAAKDYFVQNYQGYYGFDGSKSASELPNTDWYDFNSRDGIHQQYRLAFSGGNEKSTYRVSGGYEKTEGYIQNNDFQNYNLHGKFNQDISSKFSTKFDVKLSSQKFIGPCQDGFYINCPISGAAFISPLARPYLDDGSYSPYFPVVGASSNPAVVQNERTRETDVLQIIGTIGATYDFTNWLSLNTKWSMDYRQEDDKDYATSYSDPNAGGHIAQASAKIPNFQTSTVLNFDRSFNESHNISGVVGFEYRRDYTTQFSSRGEGLATNQFYVLNATATPTDAAGYTDEYRSAGYFANVKYNYEQKYFVSLTGRYDGDSRFGEDNRFGFFPGISAGWDISQEDFMSNADFVGYLKLRASYGKVGNSNFGGLGNFASRGLFSLSGTYNGQAALYPSQLSNPAFTWEDQTTINLGLDYTLFNGRINGSIDLYQKDNSQLLLNKPVPAVSSFSSIIENVGKVRNRGLELSLETTNIEAKGFSWKTRFNYSTNSNEVLELTGDEEELYPGNIQPVAVGHSINAWKVVRWAGVNPADGRPMWYDKNGDITYLPVQNDDAVFYKNGDEDFYGGLGTTLSFKGFSVDAFFQYSYGKWAYPQQELAFGINQVGGSFTNGVLERLTEAWKKPGDLASYPAATNNYGYPGTEGYYYDATDKLSNASYIRLKSLKVGYTLPATLTNKLDVGSVRLYVTGLNLVTWSDYIGYDPEVAGNFTTASVPAGRIFNGGIEVKF